MTPSIRGALALLFSGALLVGCADESASGALGAGGPETGGEGDTLRIVAATELEDLEPAIERAARELGFPIEVESPDGTLANSQALKAGDFDGDFAATWFASNRYVDLIGAGGKLGERTSIASSPVAFGVRGDKARELGWDADQPTWAEIGRAAASGSFTFGMTDPATSNSGFSALVSVSTAYADTGQALTLEEVSSVEPELRSFLSGQTLTSGSSGWLRDTFLNRPGQADGIINYESVLHSMVRDADADITVVVPADGVVSADYPLSVLASASAEEAGQVEALADWFRNHPEELTDTYRRPAGAGAALPGELSSRLLIEAPFPATAAVTDALIEAFNNRLRVPGATTFVLDVSGSMRGVRLESLQNTMHELISGHASTETADVSLRERERVSLIAFNQSPVTVVDETIDEVGGPRRAELASMVDGLVAEGDTGIYDALMSAYSRIDEQEHIPSILLMTDGELTAGPNFVDFQRFHAALPESKRAIPVFIILYGEANVREMGNLAELTGGRTFDAINGDLDDAFKEIRAYQ